MATHIINGVKIHTHHERPPIGTRGYDWIAADDNYEPGDPTGCGTTEQEAINDLLEQLETE